MRSPPKIKPVAPRRLEVSFGRFRVAGEGEGTRHVISLAIFGMVLAAVTAVVIAIVIGNAALPLTRAASGSLSSEGKSSATPNRSHAYR